MAFDDADGGWAMASARRCSRVMWLIQPVVISEEFPDICIQSPSIMDLGLLVNTGYRPDPGFRPGSRDEPASLW